MMPERNERDLVKKGAAVISATAVMDVPFETCDMSLFTYLMWRTYSDIVPGAIHRLPVKEVMEYLRIDRISKLQSSLERLGKGTLLIDYEDDEGPRSMYCHYLSSDVSSTGNGMLVFAFDPILVQFLYEPKVYATVSVSRLRDFKSIPSQRLYENMSLQFRKKHPEWHTNVEELRKVFQTGERNARFDNFRTHVIDKAVEEVNLIAEFDVLVEYVRGGRGGGVVEVVFKAVSKSHKRLIEAASTRLSTGVRKKPSDIHTVDMLDGKTFEERGGPAELTSEAIEVARDLIPEGGDINLLVSEWRESTRGRTLTDPDEHFVSWLKLKLGQEDDPLLRDIDGDVFGTLLGGKE